MDCVATLSISIAATELDLDTAFAAWVAGSTNSLIESCSSS
jgi:hypothetical protein